MNIARKAALSTIIAAGMFIGAGSASAADFDWKACKPEIEKFCKDVKGDENTYTCLQKHDENLSKPCDTTHSKYEEQTGKKK